MAVKDEEEEVQPRSVVRKKERASERDGDCAPLGRTDERTIGTDGGERYGEERRKEARRGGLTV